MGNKIFKNLSLAIIVLVILGATLYSFFRPNVGGVSKEIIQETVKEYLLENPEVVVQSLEKYQDMQRNKQSQNAQENIEANYDQIANDPTSPVLGNPDGDITVVEFFDYACGYCKRVLPSVEKLIAEDKNVRVVMKEYPILGVNSATAAKAALAVHMIAPEKYLAIHNKLMEGRITGEDFIFKQVEAVGVDVAKVKEKMESDEVMKAIEGNINLAHSIGANGTPAFIIGKSFVPGAIDYSAMKSLVAQAREEQ